MVLSVIKLRIGLLALNLFLTLAMGVQAYYGIVHPWDLPRLSKMPDAGALKYSPGTVSPSSQNLTSRITGIVSRLDPPPVEPTVTPGDIGSIDKEPPPDPEGELKPGPLGEKWEYDQCIVYGDPRMSRATLKKKSAAAAPSSALSRIRSSRARTIRTVSSRARTAIRSRGALSRGPSGNFKTLRVYDHWEDEAEDIDIWVVEITKKQFIYENESDKKLYALTRETKLSWIENEDGIPQIKGKEEEEEPDPRKKALGQKTEEKKALILLNPIDRKKLFENRNKPGSGTSSPASLNDSGGSSSPPNASHPAQGGTRPLSRVERAKQIREKYEQLKNLRNLSKNKKYQEAIKKVPPEQRKLLESLPERVK